MDGDRRVPAEKSFLPILVGVETGILGGLAMLASVALITPLLGKPWWLIPNLLASRLCPDRYVWNGSGMMTLTGAACVLMTAGAVGVVNALITPGGRLFGFALAGSWYLVSYLFLWKRVAPLLLVYAPQPLLLLAFVIYGSAIGWHPRLLAIARGKTTD